MIHKLVVLNKKQSGTFKAVKYYVIFEETNHNLC